MDLEKEHRILQSIDMFLVSDETARNELLRLKIETWIALECYIAKLYCPTPIPLSYREPK